MWTRQERNTSRTTANHIQDCMDIYMVASVDAKKQLSTAKPLVKGFNFYKSGHVFTVKSCNGDNGSRCYIKSQVLPSMKKSEVQHQMFVLGKTWTDFVVKGSLDNSLFIERVEFNSVFWAELKSEG